jgi:hypothetical protein
LGLIMSENAARENQGAGDDSGGGAPADGRVRRAALLTAELAEDCTTKMFRSPMDGPQLCQCWPHVSGCGKAYRSSRAPPMRPQPWLLMLLPCAPVALPPLSDPGPVPSASSTAGGTESDTPLGVSSTTTSSQRPKVRDRRQGSNSVTLAAPRSHAKLCALSCPRRSLGHRHYHVDGYGSTASRRGHASATVAASRSAWGGRVASRPHRVQGSRPCPWVDL